MIKIYSVKITQKGLKIMGKLKTMVAAVSAITVLCTSVVLPTAGAQAEETSVNNGWSIEYLNNATKDETHYAEFTTEEAHSGDYSLHINYPDGITEEDHGIKLRISHPAALTFAGLSGDWGEANQFRVQFYIKGNYDKYCTQLGTFDCENDNINGTIVRLNASKVTIETPDENGWAKAYFDFQYPYTSKSDFHINIFGEANDVYIDDVSVTYSGTNEKRNGTSILFGGGFEPVIGLEQYGWSYTDASNQAGVEIVKDAAGDKMLHIRYALESYDDKFVLHKNIATPSGSGGINWAKYKIYFKAKGNFNPNSIEMGNDYYDDQLGKPIFVKELDDGWNLYSVKAGGQNATGFRVKIHGYCYDMYLDDFSVVKLDTDATTEISGDHLFDGTFDNPTAEANIQPSGWFFVKNTAGDASFIATRDSSHVYSGKNAMFISAPGMWVDQKFIDIRQELPSDFDYSKSYTLKVKAYTPNVNTALNVMFSNASNAAASQVVLTEANANHLKDSWYEYTIPMTASDGCNQIRFLAMSNIGGMWIDEVSLIDVDGNEYITNGSFEEYKRYDVGSFVLMDDSGDIINKPVAGENTVENTITLYEDGLKYALYFAVYKDGALYDVVKAEPDSKTTTTTVNATITLDSVTDGKYTAKAFIWDPDTLVSYCVRGEW